MQLKQKYLINTKQNKPKIYYKPEKWHQQMHTCVEKNWFVHNGPLHISVKEVAINRNIKYNA